MAIYQISYSCGHQADKQLYGKETVRQSYMAWAAKSGQCPACGRADQAKSIEELEAELDLPSLAGSDKQIAWARKIRCEKMTNVIAHVERNILPRVTEDNREKYETDRALVMQVLAEQKAARYWIDNRDADGWRLASSLANAARR